MNKIIITKPRWEINHGYNFVINYSIKILSYLRSIIKFIFSHPLEKYIQHVDEKHTREKSFRTKKSSLVTDGATILKAKYHPHEAAPRTKFKACHRCKLMNMKISRLCTSNSVPFLLERRSKARDSFAGRIPRANPN